MQHEELPVTNFADFAGDLLSILQFNGVWKCSRPLSTICTVLHSAKFARHGLFEMRFAGKTLRLSLRYLITRSLIFHLQFKDHLIWIKCMSSTKHVDRHNLLHFASLLFG